MTYIFECVNPRCSKHTMAVDIILKVVDCDNQQLCSECRKPLKRKLVATVKHSSWSNWSH